MHSDDPSSYEHCLDPKPVPYAPQIPHSLQFQHGGKHYQAMIIQPAEYCHLNCLRFCESSAIKYLSRFRVKGGAGDLKKAIHFVQMILEMEYGITCKVEYSEERESPEPEDPKEDLQ